jgi:hypothetical protein
VDFCAHFSIKEIYMLSLLLVAAVILGFISGSVWFFTAALSALMIKMFPILLVVIALAGGAVLAVRHYFNK